MRERICSAATAAALLPQRRRRARRGNRRSGAERYCARGLHGCAATTAAGLLCVSATAASAASPVSILWISTASAGMGSRTAGLQRSATAASAASSQRPLVRLNPGRLKQIRRDFFVSNEKRRRREPGLFSAEIQRNRRLVISV